MRSKCSVSKLVILSGEYIKLVIGYLNDVCLGLVDPLGSYFLICFC